MVVSGFGEQEARKLAIMPDGRRYKKTAWLLQSCNGSAQESDRHENEKAPSGKSSCYLKRLE